jgi:hypothetical protein
MPSARSRTAGTTCSPSRRHSVDVEEILIEWARPARTTTDKPLLSRLIQCSGTVLGELRPSRSSRTQVMFGPADISPALCRIS